jgi:Rad3-related DNA helicase
MLDDLAQTISKLASRVPGGMLIFFPSYKLMNDTHERWSKRGGLAQIIQHKIVLKEPSNSAEY